MALPQGCTSCAGPSAHTHKHTLEVEEVRWREAEKKHGKCCCLILWATAALLFIDTASQCTGYGYSVMQPLLLLATATTIATMLPYSNLQPLLYATAICRPSQKTRHGKHRSRSSHYCSSMMTSESKGNYLTITSNTISRSTVRKWFINFYIRWSIQWELTCSIYFWFCCRHYYQIWTALSVSNNVFLNVKR